MYPKTFTHRNDPHSKVVVANAEQEAQLPVEYLPAVTGVSGNNMSGADHATAVMLSPEYDQLLAEREKLEQDRVAFAEEVTTVRKELAEQSQKLATDRDELTAGYKGSMELLTQDRAALDEEKRQWELTKAGGQPDATGTTETAATTTPAPDAAAAGHPAKRVRATKAD